MSLGLHETVQRAARQFRTFESGQPELIRLGIPPVDDVLGGVGPGTLVVIGLPTGTGKSSLALHMLLTSSDRGGYCSMEDPEDLVGARILAWYSEVNSLKIRRKDLSSIDIVALRAGTEDARKRDEAGTGPVLDFLVGRGIEKIEEAVQRQADAGCKFSILDYLQKVRGHHADRRSEVGEAMGRFQAACHANGMVPVVLSQFLRLSPDERPRIRHFKESGDIENEARVAIVGWRSAQDKASIRFCMEKSAYGAAGLEWTMTYDSSGSLRMAEEEEGDF